MGHRRPGRGGAHIGEDRLDQRRVTRTAEDLATIVYTSGTTGRPKGCEFTHSNLLAVARNAISALSEIFEVPDRSTLLFLPLAHVFARIIQVACLEGGAIMGHWPDTATVADGLSGFRPTFLLAVPRVFEKVCDSARRQAMTSTVKTRLFAAATQTAIAWSRADDGAGPALRLRRAMFGRLVYRRLRDGVAGRVRYAISGGAPLSERLGHFFSGAGITVLEGYGLSEATAGVTLNRPGRNKIGTVGLPLPGVGVQIAGDGEILIKDPLVSQAAVIGEGRPYVACLVTLDVETLAFWKQQHGRPGDATAGDLADDPELIAEIQRAVDEANLAVSRAESVRGFRIVAADPRPGVAARAAGPRPRRSRGRDRGRRGQ